MCVDVFPTQWFERQSQPSFVRFVSNTDTQWLQRYSIETIQSRPIFGVSVSLRSCCYRAKCPFMERLAMALSNKSRRASTTSRDAVGNTFQTKPKILCETCSFWTPTNDPRPIKPFVLHGLTHDMPQQSEIRCQKKLIQHKEPL